MVLVGHGTPTCAFLIMELVAAPTAGVFAADTSSHPDGVDAMKDSAPTEVTDYVLLASGGHDAFF
jgi:hypothetical protein